MFAAEVLYRSPDFESDVIIPSGLASVMAYCTFGLFFGWEPLFSTHDLLGVLSFNQPVHLISYTVLALFLVVLAMFYTRSFYALTHCFHQLSMPRHFKPAVGAFLTGALGVALFYVLNQDTQVLSIMSFGYGALQDALLASPATEESLRFRPGAFRHRRGQDFDDRPYDRQRRLGRSLRPVHGHRRLRRRGAGDLALLAVARLRAPSGLFCSRRHGGLFCRRRQDALFHAGDRQRNDRQL